MPLSLFSENAPLSTGQSGSPSGGRRGFSLAMSLGGHGLAFVLLMNAPEVKIPPPAKSEYEQAIKGREEKIVWYRFNQKLPDIVPLPAPLQPRPLRAENKAAQEIVAAPKAAPKRQQFIYSAAPALPDAPPVEAPNLLALRFEPPRPPAPKLFSPPPAEPTPPAPAIKLQADAPAIDHKMPEAVELPVATRRMARRFTPPPAPVKAKLTDITPPPEAPQLAVSLSHETEAAPFAFRAPGRHFDAPAARPAPELPAAPVDAPPAIQAQAPSPNELLAGTRDLNLAIVGLKPVEKATALPAAANPGKFSAAPEIRREGADAAGGAKGIAVPDLFVRGERDAKADAKPSLIAEAFAAPTAGATLRQALRTAPPHAQQEDAAPAAKAQPEGAVKVSDAPDRRFTGRDVYMMAIQMPNLTSYSGSWLMWYSDRMAHEAGLAPVSPPIAFRKVDPKYIAAAVSDRVQGTVRLACVIGRDGKVSTVELVQGLDARLNRSAEEALAKWEFTPATRQGQPVDVDVLVEIPFRLEPVAPRAF
jgi:TonB family protein